MQHRNNYVESLYKEITTCWIKDIIMGDAILRKQQELDKVLYYMYNYGISK